MKIAKLFPGYYRLARCTWQAAKLTDARFHTHHLRYGRDSLEKLADEVQVLSAREHKPRPLNNAILPKDFKL